MIDTRELRRGNFVYIQLPGELEQIVVNEIGQDYVRDQNGVVCYSIDPIPLTEEWLLKFGFHRQAEDRFYIFFKGRQLFGYFLNEGSVIIDGSYMPSKIQYTHQLQNLYFALTCEELTLNIMTKAQLQEIEIFGFLDKNIEPGSWKAEVIQQLNLKQATEKEIIELKSTAEFKASYKRIT